MIPGIGGDVLSKGGEKESINRIKRFLCMLDSLNEDELSNKSVLTPARIQRVARGSGTHIMEVH
jgi:signal recognition particle subunit SRP54